MCDDDDVLKVRGRIAALLIVLAFWSAMAGIYLTVTR